MRTGFIAVLLFCLCSFMAADEGNRLQESKQELDQIKSRLEETQHRVDSLKNLESNLQKEISSYDERVDRNRRVVQKLEGDLSRVRGELSQTNDRLDETTSRLYTKRDRYLNLLVDYYRNRPTSNGLADLSFATHLDKGRRMHYLAAVTGRSTHEIRSVSDTMQTLSQDIEGLQAENADLKQKRKEKSNRINLDLALKQKEESNLGAVRRQTTLLQDRLLSLSELARQMEDIIARLEQEQAERQRKFGAAPRLVEGSFENLKGRLRPPIQGKIVSSFGWKPDPVTGLKSFSPGVDIKPAPKATTVCASAPGRVVYVGSLRGYENFVILEHDDGFYTTYAGLAEVAVENNELVDSGQRLGVVGKENVHFELRRAREHLDPVIWLDFNAI